MAIDIRAEVSCSLGELISGSFADDYLQGNGLIKTRGEVVLAGTQTPAVGTLVTFSYDKGGNTYSLPRVLRVLSSFADPFRRTTTVQLGCKLTYLENRKPPVKDPNSKEENSSTPCYVYEKATLPISATYVLDECLTALGLTSATPVPLTNKFSVEEFSLEAGYISVISDLLQSEGYVGYLDTNEVLQFIDLSQDTGTGPLLTNQHVIDLSPIGVGNLPGESVLVRYSSERLLPPEQLASDAYLKRNWEADESYGTATEVSASYQTEAGETVTANEVFYPYEFNAIRYDIWDRKIESVSYNISSAASVNNRWASEALKNGQPWNLPVAKITHEVVTYKIGAPARNSVNLLELQNSLSIGPAQIKALLYGAALADTGTAAACIADPPDGYDEVEAQTTTNFVSELEFAGGLNVDSYTQTGVGGDTLLSFSTLADIPSSSVTVRYEVNQATGYTKTLKEQYLARLQTASGQQDLATKAQGIDTAQLAVAVDDLLSEGRTLVYEGSNTTIQTQKEFGLQRRPSQAVRNNQSNRKPVVTEQVAELAWAVGSSTSTAVTEFSLPYAPDDQISWSSVSGYSSTASDAPQKALRYGRIQNMLLMGNRNGVSLQLAPELLPANPFDSLYLQAQGVTGAYRVNGTSWAFDANGVVASTDALLWGAVSAQAGTDLSTAWVPVAPGTTVLPTPYTPVNGAITPNVVLPPYVESVPLLGFSRSTAVVEVYGYELDRGTDSQVATTRSKLLVGSKLTAAAGSVNLSGQASGSAYTRKLFGAVGAFAVTGRSAGNVRSYAIGTNAGTFSLSGRNAGLLYGRASASAVGSYALQGQDAGSIKGIRFAASNGSLALTGQTANSLRSYVVSGAAGSFTLTGQAATLTLPPPIDPYASNVVLLLHMDGANNSTTFTDSSLAARTMTTVSNAKLQTGTKKFGTASGFFSKSSPGYITAADSEDFNFGSGDFTIETWHNRGSEGFVNESGVISQKNNNGTEFAFLLNYVPSNSSVGFYWSTTGNGNNNSITGTHTFTPGTWYHIAVTRNGSTMRLFVDGVQKASGTFSGTIWNSSAKLYVGTGLESSSNGLGFLNGYLDEVRITKGVARYTSAFTPPTAAFPNP